MEHKKQAVLQAVDARSEELFALGCDIFDHPELGRQEYYACDRLIAFLEQEGFSVQRGVGGLETAFRAIWEQGSGGPAIGFMMEYDALKGLGHGCGHHLQGPVCIGAALALKAACKEPFKLVLYGTPDEEGRGGKIDMVNNGCFRDVDVMLAYHTGGSAVVSYKNKALAPIRVTFHGKPAHASGAPWKGRSAMDAMLLAFHGLEILREHVKDGCRIHYTILEGTGPSNIVHETAKTHITLRADDRHYLEEMQGRMENVIRGACLMTDTTADIQPLNVYWNLVPVECLRETVLQVARTLDAQRLNEGKLHGKGSTDVGNVSWVVPTVYMTTFYDDNGAHTEPYRDAGKSEQAKRAMVSAAEILGVTALQLIYDQSLLSRAKEEHQRAIQKAHEA